MRQAAPRGVRGSICEPTGARPSIGALAGALALAMLAAPRPADAAAVCYQLPFSNPDLGDGWGSTCCGRTNPHRGVDFPQPAGTPVPAVADGTVRVVTSTGCLGNVVVLEHADGMFSGYCHLSSIAVANGERLARGATLGTVGSTGTCSTGPHLHLTMSSSVDGYSSGTTVDPHAYIAAHQTCNNAPRGYLDSATCAGISGWAQDPDVPQEAIEVRIVIDGAAGTAGAHTLTARADAQRDDLCAAIGSCAHGFDVALPAELFDGEEHTVQAYGIDAQDGSDALLTSSPRTLRCEPAADGTPALPRIGEPEPPVDLPPAVPPAAGRGEPTGSDDGRAPLSGGCACGSGRRPPLAPLLLLAVVAALARVRPRAEAVAPRRRRRRNAR